MNLKFLRDWRLLFMLFFLVLSIISINIFPKSGVLVVSVSSNSSLYGKVQSGEYITWANEKTINTPEDLYQFNDFIGSFRFMHSGKLEIVHTSGDGLGITVSKPQSTNLNFGLDIVGGTRVLLEPGGENITDVLVQQVINVLETRINVFGLREAKIQQINDVTGAKYVQIEMAGGSKEEIENLLSREGKFEGKIPFTVKFVNNTGTLKLDNEYKIKRLDNRIVINTVSLEENDTSKMEGVDFQVLNLSENNVTIMFTVFKGTDIQSVCLQDQPGICVSRIMRQTNGWEFNFQVFITEDAAEKFAKVTKNMDIITDPNTGQGYLEGQLLLFLDENLITQLNIVKDLKGKAQTTPVITGFRLTREEAFKEQLMLKSILQSGSLPVSLNIIRVDEISPVLGYEFINAAMLSAIIASFAVMTVIYIRYRNFKILILMIFWSFSELVLTLGAASVIKWTLDLSSIAGLIAAIGTGTNDQIIVIDEILVGGGEREAYTVKQRIKRAFFIVFGAAGTIIASMLPLMFIGVGVMKGFAIVTTIGVLIGVFITRPAFGRVAEKVLGS
jgi:protein-export membrane protein SecD